jgi:hypothetical protein
MNIIAYLKSRPHFKLVILINLFTFARMLEKDSEQRFDINQVDEAIKRINIKQTDIFEGILNLQIKMSKFKFY